MKVRLKPINEQVVVITGASSGIGLATARMAAKQGAKIVAAARSGDAVKQLAEEIRSQGGQAVDVICDVADAGQVENVARQAVERFGGFDTWVNNAGASIYGRVDEVSLEDARRLFETNLWGTVNGSRTALNQLRQRGGAIVNVGSIVSDVAVPLQGYYSASKHAVKGFTDALRMEVEEAKLPISVSLIKPAAIDTPFTQHAKNYMAEDPDFPPPVYAPDVVADGILHCAQNPKRDLTIGGGGKIMTAMGRQMPRFSDKYMEATMFDQQKKDRQRTRSGDGLHSAAGGLSERGDYEGHVMKSSAYTQAAKHPVVTGAVMLGAGLAIGALLMGEESRR